MVVEECQKMFYNVQSTGAQLLLLRIPIIWIWGVWRATNLANQEVSPANPFRRKAEREQDMVDNMCGLAYFYSTLASRGDEVLEFPHA